MPVGGTGQYKLRVLSAKLREAGEEGKGLRRELSKGIRDEVKPLLAEISEVGHLEKYMPDRYAAVLSADLTSRIANSFSKYPRVEARVKGREHKRKVNMLDAGVINHPVFARGPRRTWRWKNTQTAGMKAGFFSDPTRDAAPRIRAEVLRVMTDIAKKLTSL